MNLYLIRHAIAVSPDAPGCEADSQRPLTDEGSAKMIKIAHGLKALDIHFDLILASPYLRALDTARILLKVLKMEKEQLITSENLVPMGFPVQIIGEINEKYLQFGNLAMVGHEPNLSALISLLVAGDAALSINLKKGGICHLRTENLLHERCATLEWLMMPKQLAALGENLPETL
jgi:phosphohistidine phosphatase